MTSQNEPRRPLGFILSDAGFVCARDVETTLRKQKKTAELPGHVSVRRGALVQSDIKMALSVQEHLGQTEDAVQMAAGERQMPGASLLRSGRITPGQLDHALREQKKYGQKIGEVLVGLGFLTKQQVSDLFEFQRDQGASKDHTSPLKLGQILLSSGDISRGQLNDALRKQTISNKKLGEVLVDEGYTTARTLRRAVWLQQMLVTAALIAILSGCGSGVTTETSITSHASGVNQEQQAETNYLKVTETNYNLLQANFYSSTNNASFWSIQSNIANGIHDPDFKTVIRIDIVKSEDGKMPDINKAYSIEENGQHEKFPGYFFVFNGQLSTYKKVENGDISFSQDFGAGVVNGSFDLILTDYDSAIIPAPQYRLKGIFNFKMGTYGPAQINN